MQIEKYVHITKTPTGALVSFAGQVCLIISHYEGSDSYFWRASPMFLKLTTGANAFSVPQSYTPHSSMAQAVADGLTKLDELGAFYGVIDMPEDTHGQVDEAVDRESPKYHHSQANRLHAELGVNGYAGSLADRLEHHKNQYEKLTGKKVDFSKTNKKWGLRDGLGEEVDDAEVEAMLAESFVVRKTEKKRGVKSRTMISAAAVLGRAAELAKEAGEKSGPKWVKMAHKEYSTIKAEEVEELTEGSGSKEKQKTPFRDINSPEYKAAAQKQKEQMAKDAAAKPGQALLSKIKSEEFVQYEDAIVDGLASIKEDCRAEALSMCDSLLEAQQLAGELFEDISEEYMLNELSKATLKSYYNKAHASFNNAARSLKDDEWYDHGGKEFTHADGTPVAKGRTPEQKTHSKAVIQKRLGGMSKAYRKADEAVEEITELSKATLGSYAKKANDEYSEIDDEDKSWRRGSGVDKALDKMTDGKRVGLLHNQAAQARFSASNGLKNAEKHRETFIRSVNRKMNEGFAMDDIAVGGTVIYKTLKGDHKMSKVRNKGNGFALHLQDGSTIQNHAVRSTDASDWNQFKDLKEEVLDETVNADHYNATSEPSQFGGFRPKVVHKKKGTTMYLGQHGYKTKAAAAAGAKAYLDAYEKIGDMAASRAAHAHAKNHPDSLDEEVLDEALDESLVPDRMKGKQKPYVSADGKGGYEVLGNTGQTKASFNRATHGKDAHAMAQKHLKSKYDEYMNEEVLDEATRPLSGDAYWKAKEVESKEEYLKAQRKALGLPEPVKRGRGKPTNIDRDLLKTRAHSNVEAGKRPTAGFDRNEKIHFVRHLKDHPDFAEKHVSKAGRPTGTTKVASQQQALVKKKQDTAFSMWAGLGKK